MNIIYLESEEGNKFIEKKIIYNITFDEWVKEIMDLFEFSE